MQVCRSMAPALSAAAALTALVSACLLGCVSAGVQMDSGLQYPGITGTIPACAPTAAPVLIMLTQPVSQIASCAEGTVR